MSQFAQAALNINRPVAIRPADQAGLPAPHGQDGAFEVSFYTQLASFSWVYRTGSKIFP